MRSIAPGVTERGGLASTSVCGRSALHAATPSASRIAQPPNLDFSPPFVTSLMMRVLLAVLEDLEAVFHWNRGPVAGRRAFGEEERHHARHLLRLDQPPVQLLYVNGVTGLSHCPWIHVQSFFPLSR